MSTITISAGALGARIRADHKGAPKAVERAIFSGLQRGKAYIVGKSPVDRGILRNAWRVIRLSGGGAELVNDQPYAGIIERGARPFKISQEGREALARWAYRKLLNGTLAVKRASGKRGHKKLVKWELEDQAQQISWAIAKKFAKLGMKGKRFVWKALPILANLMEEEINRSLTKFFNRPGA